MNTDRIFFSEVPSWRNQLPGYFQHFVGPVLKPKETHSLYTLLLAFYWLGGDFFFLFDRVIYLRSFIVTFCWSENQIDVSSHFDEAKIKSMYRRIVIERNSNWCIVESRELERRRVCRVSPFESEDEYIESHDESEDEYVESCDYLVERRWVYRISWLLRAKTSISSLASRAKMSMSNLANRAKMSMSNPAIESEDEYVESRD